MVVLLPLGLCAESFTAPVTIVGMVNAKNELVNADDRMTFSSDGTALTFDFDGRARNNDPGGGLFAKAKERDQDVFRDDNVALVFSESPDNVLRHLAFNVNGIIFDRIRRGKEKWDVSWNAEGVEVMSSEARSGRWRLKVRIPLTSLNLSRSAVVNVMRESIGKQPVFARSTRAVFNGKGFDLVGLDKASSEDPAVFINPFQAREPKPENAARMGEVPSTVEFKVAGADGAVLYYPGQNRMRVNLWMSADDAGTDASLVFEGQEIPFVRKHDLLTALVATPVAIGTYPISIKKGGQRFDHVASIEKRKLPWEGNSIGKTDVVLPAFKPIAEKLPGTLSVIHRDFRFGGDGLPKSITALDRELLSGPMEYVGSVDGREFRIGGEKSATVQISTKGSSAEIAGCGLVDGLKLTSRGHFEYDGFLWNELTVSGTGRIERLTLSVPFKSYEVPLFHAVAPDTIRYNPAGRIPDGSGFVWGGSKLFRKPMTPNDDYEAAVVPYVWLGAERRGLCVFVNDTHGMSLDPARDAVRIIRDGDTVRLEYDLINRPVEVKGDRRMAFGMQATPVKTADRMLSREYQCSTAAHPTNMIARVGVGWRESGFENHWARIPKDGNWQLFVDAMHRACPTADCTSFKYSDPTLTSEKDESVRYYASEWISRSTGYEGAVRTFLVPSSIDYVIAMYKQWTDLGLRGLYFDDMFLFPCRNPDTAGGSFGILEMRELVKRAAVMQYENGDKHPLLQIHMTNALLVPSFAFATSLLTWEDHYGEDLFQERFPVDYIRAESLGTQVGCEGIVLDGIKRRTVPEKEWKGANGRFRQLTRNQHALMLPCGLTMWARSGAAVDIRERMELLTPLGEFRIWEPDCEFVPFWEDDGKLGKAPEGVLMSSYRRGTEMLVIIGNLTEKNQTVELPGKVVEVAAGDVAIIRLS